MSAVEKSFVADAERFLGCARNDTKSNFCKTSIEWKLESTPEFRRTFHRKATEIP